MRAEFEDSVKMLLQMGYQLAATPGTAMYYSECGISGIATLCKPIEDQPPADAQGSVLEWIREKRIDLVINIPEGSTRTDEVTSGYLIRRTAVDFGTSLLTNMKYDQSLALSSCRFNLNQ